MAELERLFEVEQIILIPPEPGDVTGHVDGVVRFVDDRLVVVNDYRGIDDEYWRSLCHCLTGAGLDLVAIPYRPSSRRKEGMPSARGNYVNYLRPGTALVVPSYGYPEDQLTLAILQDIHPGIRVSALQCNEIAQEGGVLNCVTWSIRTGECLQRASHPIRLS